MPEGDTIHYAANRIRPVLEGHVPDEIRTPHRRFQRDRWPERLAGREVKRVEARGKHLMIRFEGNLTIHSHLRMTGAWDVVPRGSQWRKDPRRAWLVMRHGDREVIQFDGPVLELMTDGRTRFDQRIAGLGPDVVSPQPFDDRAYLRRLREDDPTRPIGDTLLDQKVVAGMGTVWRSEACWCAAIDPWRPTSSITDEEALALVHKVRSPMQQSAIEGFQSRDQHVFERAGRPCSRCGTLIRRATQGDDNRRLFWCPGCQR
ncbi:MAG: endonuclease [Solirubrobacteraceae bacterium]|nr:endonuclease [Solirubrobacteraceae bacterium]